MPETASLENVVVPGGDVRHKPQRQRPEVSTQHDILQGLDHDGAPGIGLPPPPQLGETVGVNLLSLEKVDSDGEVTGKADILRKRLVTPEAPTPEHVGNPSDALAVTIDARGEVDIDFLADLMETDVQTALERLATSWSPTPTTRRTS